MIELYELKEAAPTLISLAIIEVLLSVDNIAGVQKLAEHLPEEKKNLAFKLGAAAAYVGRIFGLLVTAPFISAFIGVKLLGAAYMMYAMSSHFTGKRKKTQMAGAQTWGLGRTVLSMILLDLILSIDNIVAAVSLTREVWVICSTVVSGVIFLRLFGGFTARVIRKMPILSETVYVLVGWVGWLLLVETFNKWTGLADMQVDSGVLQQLQHLGVRLQHAIPDLHPDEKLIGLISLIGLTLVYDGVPVLQRVVDPVLKGVALPILRLINIPLAILFWPIKKVTNYFSVEH
jgi:predicted tellurium resistance membrane protein TerC